MRASFLAAAVLVAAAAGCAGPPAYPRVHMLEEDSHPHEVAPGQAARFHIPATAEPARVDVKCALTGPAAGARIAFHGIRPLGWAARDPRVAVGGREVHIDIEGIAEAGHPGPYFAIANDGTAGLLWHQCYNN